MSSTDASGFAPIGSRRAKWFVLAFWVVLLAVSVPLAGKLSGVEKNDNAAYLPASAESTQVTARLRGLHPADSVAAVVIYERGTGITEADRAKAASDAAAVGRVAGVAGPVTAPQLAVDQKALELFVPVSTRNGGWSAIGRTVSGIRAVTSRGASGLSVRVTGDAAFIADTLAAFNSVDSTLLLVALAVVVAVLLVTYRSPVLWLFPVASVGVALAVAQAVVYLLARAGLTVNSQSASILTVLVFGVGTDYALLLVARYREELRRHVDRHDAMAVALRRTGPAIVASAATVAVGMLCLTVAEDSSTRGMGPVAAIGVGIGLLAMTSLLPALLLLFDRWIFWPARPLAGSAEAGGPGIWSRVGSVIARRPRLVWVLTVLVLTGMATGLADLKANGVPPTAAFVNQPDSVVGARVMAAHFPAGGGEPVFVTSASDAAERVRNAVAATRGIASVAPPQVAGGTALIAATLVDAPSSEAAQATIVRVRTAVRQVSGSNALVGGFTATLLDVNDSTRRDRNLIIPLVLLVVMVILGVVLRSLVAPLVLIATVVLSFGAALGVSALIFDHVFGWVGADTSFPLFVFVFLVALGIDYNIFLMTRVREEARRLGARAGVLEGLAATGGVITSAGLVLAGTFGALGVVPVIAYAEIGFAIALGVLLDTLIVRSVLVTAIGLDLGQWIWWPLALSARAQAARPEARVDAV